MAYAVDVEEIYHADAEMVDVGVIDTYDIQLDIANEKDFVISTNEAILTLGGFWYIPETEFGGIIDAFDSDSSSGTIDYTGRSWRGLLASHIVDVTYETRLMQGDITEVVSELITEASLDDLFEVDEPDTHLSIDTEINYEIAFGTNLYDAITGMATSAELNYVYSFNADRKIHVMPILIQDYTDYMKSSDVVDTGFKISLDQGVPNHLVISSVDDEDHKRRTIHLFTDENGGVQPYATSDPTYEDSDYILGTENQVLFGTKEIAEYMDEKSGAMEKYKPLQTAPADWEKTFANYFRHVIDEETGEESWEQVEAEGEDTYTLLSSQPSDWATRYSSYYTKSIDEDLNESYSAVSGVKVVDYYDTPTRHKITKQPSDWNGNYGDYYYRFWNGNVYELRSIDGVSKNRYVRMTKKPSDWNSNFSSYYRKVYEKITYDNDKKKIKTLVDCLDRKDAKYVSVAADDDGKGKTLPSFSKRPHYRQEQYTVAPKFDASNTWMAKSKEVAPTFQTGTYYRLNASSWHAPTFAPSNFYERKLDHYQSMVDAGLETFESNQKTKRQTMGMDEFQVVIGDIVGGRDEFTGTEMAEPVTNIEVTINNGILKAEYIVGDA